ncbi:MAG: hypothetical protein ABFS09_12260 [Thermodesulfobacteriota bacterium]
MPWACLFKAKIIVGMAVGGIVGLEVVGIAGANGERGHVEIM